MLRGIIDCECAWVPLCEAEQACKLNPLAGYRCLDPWGGSWHGRCCEERCEVRSAGPDGEHGTSDDEIFRDLEGREVAAAP